ncbi:hypothetical protein [Neorhizobium sp. JUb45]|uniref:DUF6630 family protein n=2 Tax=unclassified Neorhizobium TaxID=2629175 RepID=UPI00105073DA|nr:hypothetical protein [Neorhizobium sp. JUb45]
MVDARFFERGSRKSPWIEIEGRPPTLAEIQSYWRPVTEPAMQKRVETAFLAVERHITRHHMADATEEHKLQHVSRQELDWNSLGQFCTVLGGSTKETRAFIDDHLMFAAYNPQNYLRTHGLLDNMTLDDCREFTWLSLLMDSDSHFYRSHHICVVDWKTEGDEVEFCINRLLKTERPDTEDRVDLGGDGVMSATDDWLAKASGQLERLALQILLIDSGGDNYVFTLADSRKAKRLVSLGKMIGLVVDVFPSPQAGGKGWFGRIMTMFSR